MTTGTRKGESGTEAHPAGERPASGNVARPAGNAGDVCAECYSDCRSCDAARLADARERARARVNALPAGARPVIVRHGTTTPPREAHPAHTGSTLGTVQDHTEPEPPVLIPQHGSTGGRKPYNVRLRKALVAEVMDRPEYEGLSLAQVIELALERLLP
jgi:hypothetical protein